MITKKVVLLGKTNVGKSSLYNVLTGGARALVSPIEHVTRDALIAPLRSSRDYHPSDLGFCVEIVDLAGFDFQEENFISFHRPHTDFFHSLRQHVLRVVDAADLILALFDLKNITPIDREIVAWIQKRNAVKKRKAEEASEQKNQPVLYVFNKLDGEKDFSLVSEAYELSIKNPFFVSAKSRRGLSELVRAICSTLREKNPEKIEENGDKTGEKSEKLHENPQNLGENGDKFEKKSEKISENLKETVKFSAKVTENSEKSSENLGENPSKMNENFEKDGENLPKVPANSKKSENSENTEVKEFSAEQKEDFCISIVGKPNAGKSSLLNILLREQRALVSDMPGTTRDSIACDIVWRGVRLTLFDTAGMRRKSQKKDKIEEFSVKQSIKSIRNSSLSLLLVDATLPISEQDKKISAVAFHHNKALMVIFNKWDLVRQSWKDFVDRQLFLFPLLKNFILLPFSAKTGYHLSLLKKKILLFEELSQKKHSTPMLNRVLQQAVKKTAPPSVRISVFQNARNPKKSKCKYLVFKPLYAAHISSLPFVVKIFCHHAHAIKPAYESYLMRHFRDAFSLQGFPIHIIFEEISRDKSRDKVAK